MTKKKIAALLLSATMACAALSGCAKAPQADAPAATEEQPQETAAPEQEAVTASATAGGFGGPVTVTVTVKDGTITEVTAIGEQETEGVGSRAIEQMPAAMVEANSVAVDAVSGCTVTSNAILTAAKAAYNEAMGVTVSASMAAGTYSAQAYGHYIGCPITVEVDVSEEAIEAIRVTDGGQETEPILNAAVEKLIPRMIENNSVAVDAITGATESSSAIKAAAADCVIQALEAAGNGADGISAFQTIPEKKTETETMDVDVLVVGMGGSGVAAALRAAEVQAEAGKAVNVLGIEKAGKYGGTVAVTAEMLAVNPEKFMEEYNGGKEYVDLEAMLAAWMEYTEQDADEALVRLDLENSGDALDWMCSHGWEFAQPVTGFSPQDIWVSKYMYLPNDNYGNRVAVNGYFAQMMDDYTALGGKYLLEVEGQSLITDETGAVTGVNALGADGTSYVIHAKQVVLATGGFAENGEMCEKYLSDTYYPLKGKWAVHGLGTNDGKMIQSAIDAGAATFNIDNPPVTHLAGPEKFFTQFEKNVAEGEINFFTGKTPIWSQGDIPLALAIAPDGLAVAPTGKRYTDEYMLDHFNTWMAGPSYYTIWSDEQLRNIKENGFDWNADGPCFGWLGCQCPIPSGVPMTQMDEVIAAALDAGILWEADSIEELAGKIGMDGAVLAQTVSTYNSYVDAGEDAEFGKNPAYLDSKVEGNKYYALKAVSYCYTIGGGLKVDTSLRVLDENGQPIPGLIAAGTDAESGLYSPKKAYVTYGGSAAGWAWTSGYLAGRTAAEAID